MPNKKQDKREGNIYDRIFRENADQIFIPFLKQFLRLDIASYKTLTVTFPKTSEKVMDTLYEVEQSDKSKWILHIEFQSKNDADMLHRMQEYHSKIYSKFKLPVKGLVINLGKYKFTARKQLLPEEVFTGYECIDLFELSTDEFLSAQVPGVVIMALLSNYEPNQLEAVLRLIVQQLKRIVTTEKDMQRYINQLLILSRLRNFEIESEKILEDMPITYDIETDGLYLKGIKKGTEIGTEKGIEIGLTQTILFCNKLGMLPKEIAEEFGLEESKVIEVLKAHK